MMCSLVSKSIEWPICAPWAAGSTFQDSSLSSTQFPVRYLVVQSCLVLGCVGLWLICVLDVCWIVVDLRVGFVLDLCRICVLDLCWIVLDCVG